MCYLALRHTMRAACAPFDRRLTSRAGDKLSKSSNSRTTKEETRRATPRAAATTTRTTERMGRTRSKTGRQLVSRPCRAGSKPPITTSSPFQAPLSSSKAARKSYNLSPAPQILLRPRSFGPSQVRPPPLAQANFNLCQGRLPPPRCLLVQ